MTLKTILKNSFDELFMKGLSYESNSANILYRCKIDTWYKYRSNAFCFRVIL